MMKLIAFVSLLLLQTLIAHDATPSISVPKSISPCSPVPLEIDGGSPPYSVSIMKADKPSGPALQEFSDVRQPSNLSWGSTLPEGTIITFQVKDSKGLTANSDQSSVTGGCAQGQPASNPSAKILTNTTASNSSSNNVTNAAPPADGTAANTLTPVIPPIAGNGSTNAPDLNMGSVSSNISTDTNTSITAVTNATISPNSTVPDATIAPNSTGAAAIATPNSPKNSTQLPGSSVNINNPRTNQTSRPPSKQASLTSKINPLNSFHSVLLTAFIAILFTWM